MVEHNYRGILNLIVILLVLSNARAALENIIKYGILVDPWSWLLFLLEGKKHTPALVIFMIQSIHIGISLCLEKLMAIPFESQQAKKQHNLNKSTRERLVLPAKSLCGIILNLAICLALPPIIIFTQDTHPISTSGALMFVSIVFLKLLSYHMVNYWCRDSKHPPECQSCTTKSFLKTYSLPIKTEKIINTNGHNKADKTTEDAKLRPKDKVSPIIDSNGNEKTSKSSSPVSNQSNGHASQDTRTIALTAIASYPKNVTVKNMIEYISYPTLCYELEYAKTNRIRKRFLIRRCVEFVVLLHLDLALIQQWLVPTVSNSVLPFRQMRFSHMLERLLKLAIPNHVIWLIWFYLFFHSFLNIVAELTHFADRQFYRDWWNSESVNYFWANWNIPVHKWCARHIYVPLMSRGFTKCQASTVVFFVSAFFHEYLVSVPLNIFRIWAFTGMLVQLPFARFVSLYFNNFTANVAVWVSIIIGQPLCILMYYHDYYVMNM